MTDPELIKHMLTEMNDLKSQMNQLQIFINEKLENNDQINTNTDTNNDTNTNIEINTLNVNLNVNSDFNDENSFEKTSNTSEAKIIPNNNNTNIHNDLNINETEEKTNDNDNQVLVTSTNIDFKSESKSKSTSTVEQPSSKHDEQLETQDSTLEVNNEIKSAEDSELQQDVKTDGSINDDSVEIVMAPSVSPQMQPHEQVQAEEQAQWKRQAKRTITTQHDEFVCDERNRSATVGPELELELELMELQLKEEKEEHLVPGDNDKDYRSSVSINTGRRSDDGADLERKDRVEQDDVEQGDAGQYHVAPDTGSKGLMIDMEIVKSQSSISIDQRLLANDNNNNGKKIINLGQLFDRNERNNSDVDYKICEKHILEEMKNNYKYFEFCHEISKFDQMFKERQSKEDWQQNVKILYQAEHIVNTFLVNDGNGLYLENIDSEMKREAKNQLQGQLNHPSDFRLTPTLFNSCKRVSCKDICLYCFYCFCSF